MRFDSFGEFLARVDAARPAVHVAALIGHGSVRELTMGLQRRAPTTDELAAMRRCVAEAMDAGAVGLSTGLIYVPGMYCETDEIVTLAGEAARSGGIYASHIRGEGAHLFRAVDEAIEVGRRAGIPVHVSHLKCETSFMWGRAPELLARVHGADDATGDQYPYAAWASVLWSLLPEWAPVTELPRLLGDHTTRARLIASVERGEGAAFQSSVDGVGWDHIVIEATADVSCNGRTITEIADRRGLEPVDAFFELLIEEPSTSCIGHAMHDDDVRTIMADPDVMVASDAASVASDGPMADVPVHPRTYGTFPRVLGPVVRDGLLTLEAAVRKMTSLPADRFGLTDRGRIVEGAWADLVVFDPATVNDRATFDRPHVFPEGIEAVIVEGAIAWRAGMTRSRVPAVCSDAAMDRVARSWRDLDRVGDVDILTRWRVSRPCTHSRGRHLVSGPTLGLRESIDVAHIGRERRQHRESIDQDALVEELSIEPNVGEHAIEPVGAFDVELQLDVAVAQGVGCVPRGLLAEALIVGVRAVLLWRVDADQAHGSLHPGQVDSDRVAVGYLENGDLGPCTGRRVRLRYVDDSIRRRRHARDDRDREDERNAARERTGARAERAERGADHVAGRYRSSVHPDRGPAPESTPFDLGFDPGDIGLRGEPVPDVRAPARPCPDRLRRGHRPLAGRRGSTM